MFVEGQQGRKRGDFGEPLKKSACCCYKKMKLTFLKPLKVRMHGQRHAFL